MNISANINLDHLQNLLFPELLEDSKILSILSEDFNFKLDDFINLKEVQKISTEKEEIISLLKQMKFITFNETFDSCFISIPEEFTLISLLNVPSSVQNKSDLISMIKVQEFDRLYKKNFFIWYLVIQVNQNENILNDLKSVHIKEEKLKFEVYSNQVIKKNVIKRLQNINYHKETSGLKSNQSMNSSNNNSENGSWRKKSTDSEELSFKKGSNRTNDNNQEKTSSLFRRKRFNSDGGEDIPKFNNNEIVGSFKTVLNDSIKYRYNLKKLFDVFEENTENFRKSPEFVNFIDDICTREKRGNLNILSPNEISVTNKRDRSKTFHISEYQTKFNFRETSKIILPKNNPLQDFGNLGI